MRAEAAVKTDNAPLLNARGVSAHYDGAISALENIDFCVPEKALVALLGANGAGKTTLMMAIAGMLPFERGEVTAGDITMNGVSCWGAHPATITRLGIALVQDGRQCFRGMTVAENLRAAALLKPGRRRDLSKAQCGGRLAVALGFIWRMSVE